VNKKWGGTGFTVGLEAEISPTSKSFTLPLNYTLRNFTFGVSLPYIYQRKLEYAASSVEASGVGDIAGSIGYSGLLGSMLFNINVSAKLPTGDDENMVDGYLAPLGTGSTDWMINLSFMKSFRGVFFTSSFAYKLNGTSDKIAEIVYSDMDNDTTTIDVETINYDITNGNIFTYTGGLDFLLGENWVIGGWVNFINVGEGFTDETHSFSWDKESYTVTEISNQRDMMLLDIAPMVSYRLMMTDLTLMVKVPVLTEVNENNPMTDRDLNFIFKIGRKL